MKMRTLCGAILAAAVACSGMALAGAGRPESSQNLTNGTVEARADIAKFDPNMAVEGVTVTNGLKWIDGTLLPIEGRAFDDVEHWYESAGTVPTKR